MSGYTFRPAVRENTPLIIGIAGPTKSGKTMSALRVATGLANGGTIAMINAEGMRGHQYADKFKYVTCDMVPPFRPDSYTDALTAAETLKPSVVIIDSVSHMHDGPGGVLEWHEEILDRMAGNDRGKRDKCTFTAWVEPKASENQFIYKMLGMKCPVILCLRAKEKIKIVAGRPPIDLGWQPIVGERVAFETIFTLMLTPHCKGVPDLSLSDMRDPFDNMIPKTEPLSERTGKVLAEWATGKATVQGDNVLSGADAEIQAALTSGLQSRDAPAPITDDPAEPYRAKLRTCDRSERGINATYLAIPETIRQDCYDCYTEQLNKLKKGK